MRRLILAIMLISLASCSVQKRRYSNGFYFSRVHSRKIQTKEASMRVPVQSDAPVKAVDVLEPVVDETPVFAEAGRGEPSFKKNVVHDKDTCDVIIMKNGDIIRARVMSVAQNAVEYRLCDNPTGPIFSKPKREVYMIKHSQGAIRKFEEPSKQHEVATTPNREMNTNAVVGFVLAMIGLSPIGFFFGLSALEQMSREPDRYRGKAFAIIAVVIGGIFYVLMILIILAFMGMI